jgi:putative aldouronate transport system permease protein
MVRSDPEKASSAKQLGLSRNWDLYILILPALVYFILFYYVPIYGLQIAFKDFSVRRGIVFSPWVGFKHFKMFFSSYYFSLMIKNTLLISAYQLIFNFPAPLLLALSINEIGNRFFKKILQTITYAPHFLSIAVVISMLISFLDPESGIINHILVSFNGKPYNFITDPRWFKPLYVISGIWQHMGWGSIIYLAALSSIDPGLYEAAKIDGANRFQRILHINIPSLLPTVVVLFILETGRVMNIGFEKVFLMQNDLNLNASEVISTYIYRKGILGAQYSFSTAVGLFNSLINFFLLITVNKISKKISEVSLW